MTDRQFVRQYFPHAVLEYWVRTHNTLRSTTGYYIFTHPRNHPDRYKISGGSYREKAWNNAKKFLMRSDYPIVKPHNMSFKIKFKTK